MAGHSLPDIAERLEFPSGAAVAKAITDEIKREAAMTPAEDRDTLLKLQNDRLSYMLSKIWQDVEFGNLQAIEQARKLLADITKLNQLDAVDATTHTTQVLVIGGAETDYIEKLKQLTDEVKEIPGA